MRHENKELIIMDLYRLLKRTRGGDEIKALVYDPEREVVEIIGYNGYIRPVNVACDSGIQMIKDVMKEIEV